MFINLIIPYINNNKTIFQ
uniref:Uncharacterized protein n=1 Tax=Rhizophora mucronata TaxID=61149 RepID=A0A2P2NU86_RHIMU